MNSDEFIDSPKSSEENRAFLTSAAEGRNSHLVNEEEGHTWAPRPGLHAQRRHLWSFRWTCGDLEESRQRQSLSRAVKNTTVLFISHLGTIFNFSVWFRNLKKRTTRISTLEFCVVHCLIALLQFWSCVQYISCSAINLHHHRGWIV